jgi:hypothetical protein
MGRLIVVLALIAIVGMIAARYRSGKVRDVERGASGFPALPVDLRGPTTTWVVLSTPMCATCGPVTERLHAAFPNDTVTRIDVSSRPSLAEDYDLRRAPTVIRAEPSGAVTHRLVGPEAVASHLDQVRSISRSS